MDKDPPAECPLVAAYIAGRRAWEASWAIEQASLLGDTAAVAVADEAITTLIVDVADVLSQISDEPVEKFIQNKRVEWHENLESEWYAESYYEANAEWQEQCERPDIDPEQCRQEACEALLRTVADISEAIRSDILSHLDRISVLAFQLGECLEQGLRPPKVYRWMKQQPGKTLAAKDGPRVRWTP